MAIRAVVFDLGGVLLEIDWERCQEDQPSELMIADFSHYEQLNPRMLQLLKRLRPAYTLATLCNGGSRQAMIHKFRLHELVDLMIFDDEEGVSKPDERIYLVALQRLKLRAAEALFVDDTYENVAAARRLGMHGVHFQHARQAVAEIEMLLSDAHSVTH